MTPVKRLRSGFRHQVFVLQHELFARFHVVGIVRDALDRTDLDALRVVEVADAFGAQVRIDHVVLLAQRDGLVRAHGFADVAVDAGVEDDQGHPDILPPFRPRVVAANAPRETTKGATRAPFARNRCNRPELHRDEAEGRAAGSQGVGHALLVGLVADEQHDHVLERARVRTLERLDHEIGRLGRLRATEDEHVARGDAAGDGALDVLELAGAAVLAVLVVTGRHEVRERTVRRHALHVLADDLAEELAPRLGIGRVGRLGDSRFLLRGSLVGVFRLVAGREGQGGGQGHGRGEDELTHDDHLCFQELRQRWRMACCTAGCTKPEISPPRRPISRTSEEEMKLYCSAGVRNSVSAWGIRWRFMLASWNSYSKSDTARRPRRTTPAPISATKWASRQSKPRTSTLGRSASARRASAMRSPRLKPGPLFRLSATATTMRSNRGAARDTRSA